MLIHFGYCFYPKYSHLLTLNLPYTSFNKSILLSVNMCKIVIDIGSVDPDQMLHSGAADLSLRYIYLLRPNT